MLGGRGTRWDSENPESIPTESDIVGDGVGGRGWQAVRLDGKALQAP